VKSEATEGPVQLALLPNWLGDLVMALPALAAFVVVRELRGSLQVHEHGIVITPSDFTSSAQAEADEKGKTHISLINGEQLVELLIEHQVGVAKEEYVVPILDDDYWGEILGESLDEPEEDQPETSPEDKQTADEMFPLPIQAEYKGEIYKAELLDLEGNVKYAGKDYDSPSGAAKVVAVDWKAVNGWAFWQYYDSQIGQWKYIGELRQVIYL